jgi:hypothetical protein
MNKGVKTVLIVAAAIIALGVILCAAVIIFSHEDLKDYRGRAYTYEKYVFDASLVRDIRVKDSNRALKLLPADDRNIKACCYEAKDDYYDISLSDDGLLEIIRVEKKRWPFGISLFDLNVGDDDLTVYVPSGMLEDITADTSNGSISYGAIELSGSLRLTSSNGRIRAEDLTAGGNIYLTTSNGSITLEAVTAAGNIFAVTSNGRVGAENVGAEDIRLESSNGSVTAVDTAASERLLIDSSNGDIKVENIDGSEIELSTSNSRVSGSIRGRMSDYAIISGTSNASNNLPNGTDGEKRLVVRTSNGSIDITFTDG